MLTLSESPRSTTSATDLKARFGMAARALGRLAHEPGRLDQVLLFSQAINLGALSRAVRRLSATDEGRRLLAERPRIDRAHVDYDALRRLPDGSLGREYVRFLDANSISPEPFEMPPDIANADVVTMMQRMRQTHDLWHVLTGYTPDFRGEILLQVFTYAQTEAPSTLLLALLGSLRFGLVGRQHLRDMRTAWERGKTTRFLPTFWWEDHWTTPVAELRKHLCCPKK